MLRLPRFELREPESLDEALALLAEHGEDAMPVAGGTDLLPNMKHQLFEPKMLVSLARINELAGVREEADGSLSIGAMTRIAEVARDERLRAKAPALAQAAGLIAGPQLRTMGTLGGNVMLETRCQWYNQTYFWRKALGYCLKKDGTLCHVVAGGKKCVAAASNDSAPALMTVGAQLEFQGPAGRRSVSVDELWKSDGIVNKKVEAGELLTRIRIPAQAMGHHGAYGKLRDRGSIDFPLLGVAVRLDLDPAGAVQDADIVLVALAAKPVRIRSAAPELCGTRPADPDFEDAARRVAQAAHRQCTPLANVPGDHEYRKRMVPVYVRRTILAAARGDGPVHAI
jgi:4-hydroxybenzoyl-CoA reductase subunit beta